MTGTIFDIKELSLHDGPGVRTTVFLKGCPLRCRWCHNPEGLSPSPQLMVKETLCTHCGRCLIPCAHRECAPFGRCVHACPQGLIAVKGEAVQPRELAERLRDNAAYCRASGGGITLSGGEPLMQAEFVGALAELLRDNHLAIQTSGYARPETFRRVAEQMDYVMLDLKLADRELHKQYTGVYNDVILENLAYLKDSGKAFVIRTPLIPGITDTSENLGAIEKIIDGAPWEKLEYNAMAGAKYPMLGMRYELER